MNTADLSAVSGTVFGLETFSLHNGPGIRTTLFLKGCPLECLWCSNPESQDPRREIIYNRELCLGACTICPPVYKRDSRGAVVLSGKMLSSFSDIEDYALECPSGALSISGRTVTAGEIMQDLLHDRIFFRESGGGVTISGGEPLYQTEFTLTLLRELKKEGIHTAVDTCGEGNTDNVLAIVAAADLVLFDVKSSDPENHKKLTGKTNSLILGNLKAAASEFPQKMHIRYPFIPGLNTSDKELAGIADLLTSLHISEIDLIPYHRLGSAKYGQLGREYPGNEIAAVEEPELIKAEVYFRMRKIRTNRV